MSAHPWIKFYPRDWRGDQALRVVSLGARGLWIEMICVMHEATPYGHLLVGGQRVSDDVLARLVGASVPEVQAQLVELRSAGVFKQTRAGVIYSKRMTDDYKRSVEGRKAKELALAEAKEKVEQKARPSRVAKSPPTTQKPDTRAEVEGPIESPSTLCRRQDADAHADGASSPSAWLGPQSVRDAFAKACGEAWCRRFIDGCPWQDVPERALIVPHKTIGTRIIKDAKAVLVAEGLTVLERAA